MKKIFSIFLTIATVAFMAVSCQEEPAYEPGPQDVDGCYGVYFPSQPATGSHTYDPTMPTVQEFIVARTNSDDSIDVPYEVVDPKGIYQCGPIHFDAGQKETTFEVTFDNAEMGVEYPLTISITDNQYASLYGDKAIAFDFSAFRVEWVYFTNPAGEKAKVTFNETWWGEIHTGYIKYYEVDGVRHCVTESDPVDTGDGMAYGFWGTGANPGEGEFEFIWYTNAKCYGADGETTYQAIQVPVQTIWYHTTYSEEVKFFDYYAYWTVMNPQDALVGMDYPTYCSKYSGNYPSSYYDGNGGFYFYAYWYYMLVTDGGWKIEDYDPYCIADGFTRTDYSIEAESDFTVDGVVPVYFTTGVDAKSIKYVAVEGELTATQTAKVVDAIIDNSQEGVEVIDEFEYDEEENVNYSAVGLSFETSSYYTVVAVTYDEAGKPQANTSIVVNYISPDDAEANAVEITIGAEAAPARYELDPYTTMAYYIAGHVLTDVHVAIVPLAKVTDATFDQVKYDDTYAVDDETRAKINATGGLYDYVTKLAPNTDYVLIVWATNGSLDKTMYATYTTPRLPYVWNEIGQGTITDDIASCVFNLPNLFPTVACDVAEEATTPGLYKISNFSLAMASALWGEDMTRYTGNWHEVEIIVDATDPNNVQIEEQDYGICCNSSYGFFTIFTNPDKGGVLKDGVMSFAEDEVYACLPDYGSYWLTDGLFQITLPEAANVSVPAYAPGKYSPANIKAGNGKAIEKIAIERDIKAASYTSKTIAPRAGDQNIDKNNIVRFSREDIAF